MSDKNISDFFTGSYFVSTKDIKPLRFTSEMPSTFRLAQYPNGKQVVQGGYIWNEGFKSGIVWHDLPVVMVGENGQEIETKQPEWPTDNRIDVIGQNGNTGEHYENVELTCTAHGTDGVVYPCEKRDNVYYRINPHGNYALYLHADGSWRENAKYKNNELRIE